MKAHFSQVVAGFSVGFAVGGVLGARLVGPPVADWVLRQAGAVHPPHPALPALATDGRGPA